MYDYETEKAWVLTDEGAREFTKARDTFLQKTKETHAARAGLIFACTQAGDTWRSMALLDRMVELGDIRYLASTNDRAWQNRIVERK